jgi:quinolinate synthase
VHKTIRPEQVVNLMGDHPDIELLLHPECGCVSSCMAKAADGTLPPDRTFFLSTEGMLRHIGESTAGEFAVGTETGIFHQLNKKFPEKRFYPVNPDATCAFMKTITLDRVIKSLETMSPQIRVPEPVASRAKRAIDRMLELA